MKLVLTGFWGTGVAPGWVGLGVGRGPVYAEWVVKNLGVPQHTAVFLKETRSYFLRNSILVRVSIAGALG